MSETFECTKCGKCCIASGKRVLLTVTPDEVAGMAMCLGTAASEFAEMFLDGSRMKLCSDGACPMVDPETNLCRVYESRPAQCRAFPYWAENYDSGGRFTLKVRDLCEGIIASDD